MSKILCLGTLLLMSACSFDPSGLPTQPTNDAAGDDSNTQADASGPDAMADAPMADAPVPDAAIPDAAIPDAPLPPCATDLLYVANPATGRQYRLYDTNRNWTEARDDCELDGAHLVVINDVDENVYVRSLDTNNNNLWIGLNDRADENTFVWVTGAPVSYTNWEGGEPNDGNSIIVAEDCTEMRNNGNGQWNDQPCGDGRRFVCECDPSIPVPEL